MCDAGSARQRLLLGGALRAFRAPIIVVSKIKAEWHSGPQSRAVAVEAFAPTGPPQYARWRKRSIIVPQNAVLCHRMSRLNSLFWRHYQSHCLLMSKNCSPRVTYSSRPIRSLKLEWSDLPGHAENLYRETAMAYSTMSAPRSGIVSYRVSSDVVRMPHTSRIMAPSQGPSSVGLTLHNSKPVNNLVFWKNF